MTPSDTWAQKCAIVLVSSRACAASSSSVPGLNRLAFKADALPAFQQQFVATAMSGDSLNGKADRPRRLAHLLRRWLADIQSMSERASIPGREHPKQEGVCDCESYKTTGVILPSIVQYTGTRTFTRDDGSKIDIPILQEVSLPMKWTLPGPGPQHIRAFHDSSVEFECGCALAHCFARRREQGYEKPFRVDRQRMKAVGLCRSGGTNLRRNYATPLKDNFARL